jgi:hypothetical protein
MALPYLSCNICGHKWIARNAKLPDACPMCCNRYWNKTEYKHPVVYFIRKGADGPIKIGHTSVIRSRLALMQSHCDEKLKILAVLDGGTELETSIKKRFASLARYGEWYTPGQELLDFISGLTVYKSEVEFGAEPEKLSCNRCGHKWLQRKEDLPQRCAKCNSPYWNRERVKPKGADKQC